MLKKAAGFRKVRLGIARMLNVLLRVNLDLDLSLLHSLRPRLGQGALGAPGLGGSEGRLLSILQIDIAS